MVRSLLATFTFVAVELCAPHGALAQETSTSAPIYATTEAPPPAHTDGRRWHGPRFMLTAQLGVSAMNEGNPFGFGTGVGAVVNGGPAWAVGAGVDVLPWLGFEARYAGMQNAIKASAGNGLGFLTTGALGLLSLTAPLPYVHPYIIGGIGYYNVARTGSYGPGEPEVFRSSAQPGIPMGVGLDVPMCRHFSVGMEAMYHFQLGESYSATTTNGIDGGDFSTFNVETRFYF